MRVPFPWKMKGQIPTLCHEREESLLRQCFLLPSARRWHPRSVSLMHFHPQIRAEQHLPAQSQQEANRSKCMALKEAAMVGAGLGVR